MVCNTLPYVACERVHLLLNCSSKTCTVAPPGNLITNAPHAVCTWRLEDQLMTTHFPVGA